MNRRIPFDWAWGCSIPTVFSQARGGRSPWSSAWSFPTRSSRDRGRPASGEEGARRRVDRPDVLPLLLRQAGVRNSSTVPMIPFKGVRISWLMFARNRFFARFASSAREIAPVSFLRRTKRRGGGRRGRSSSRRRGRACRSSIRSARWRRGSDGAERGRDEQVISPVPDPFPKITQRRMTYMSPPPASRWAIACSSAGDPRRCRSSGARGIPLDSRGSREQRGRQHPVGDAQEKDWLSTG